MIFLAPLVRNLVILASSRVWLLHFSLDVIMLSFILEEATFSSLSIKPSTKALYIGLKLGRS